MCRAQIPAEFKLLPDENQNASAFSFKPTEGILEVGETKSIKVQLQSDLLGAFTETFRWALTGSPKDMSLQFKGSIIGPKFEVLTLPFANLNMHRFLALQHMHNSHFSYLDKIFCAGTCLQPAEQMQPISVFSVWG